MPLTCTIAGASFRPAAAKEAIKTAAIGDAVTLDPDLQNEFDPYAVRVLYKFQHIGFIPRDSNVALFNALVDGQTITAKIIAFESTLKPVLEVEL